jgi:hypothetical protein
MNSWKFAQVRLGQSERRALNFIKVQATLATIATAIVAPLFLLVSLVPQAPVMPVLCLLATASSLGIAAFAWWRGATSKRDRVSIWDVAGALQLVGVAAGMLSEPDQVLRLFGHAMITG